MAKRRDYLDLLAETLWAKGKAMGRDVEMTFVVANFQVHAAEHLEQYEQALVMLLSDGVLNNTWPWDK